MKNTCPAKHRQLLYSMRMAGATDSEIAAATNLSLSSVRGYLSYIAKEMGIKFPRRATDWNGTYWTKEKLAKLEKATRNKSYRAAGKEFGISGVWVYQLMSRYTRGWVDEQRGWK